MSALLIFGMFVLGFYAAELLGVIAKVHVGAQVNFFYGFGFACIGAWVALT